MSSIKNHRIITLLALIALVLTAWWAWVSFSPKPLGDKLKYLGKEDYGNVFGFDSKPYSVYYYGTDMDERDIAHYFKDISTVKELARESGDGYSAPIFSFQSSHGEFTLVHYSTNLDAVMRGRNFKNTKKYLVSIIDSDYSTALQSLK